MMNNFILNGQPYSSPTIMGVLNITPDSFSDGGTYSDVAHAISCAKNMIRDGAKIIDIGGESTRPGADVVRPEEEIKRIVPVIEQLRKEAWFTPGAAALSVDTRNAATMAAALAAGVDLVNDISALTHDPDSVKVLAKSNVPIVLMHMKGTPQTMQNNPCYDDLLKEMMEYFAERVSFCATFGIEKERLILDPGIGFGKTLEHNLLVLGKIKDFHRFGCPLLLGTSRKSFIGHIDGGAQPTERLPGSIASALWGLSMGINIFRVHDVRETRQAFSVYQAISEAGSLNVTST